MSRNKYPEETYNLILDVSQQLFLQKGYEHTTIQDIINHLGGLTKGAVYHHFKSKEDILFAVTNRIFQENTLSIKWKNIANNSNLNGGEKIKQMLLSAIHDEQEQKFRRLGINFQKMPQMLSDLFNRSIKEIAPQVFQPILEEGIMDGSVKSDNPREYAELLALIANTWMNPLVLPMTEYELREKFKVVCQICMLIGLDISDIYDELSKMNKELK